MNIRWISMILKSLAIKSNNSNEESNAMKIQDKGNLKGLIERVKEKEKDYDENLMKIADIIENNTGFNIKKNILLFWI